ncbi:hypothetical protein OK016_15140 [Vibrio chagasii]|nr:hypothetical protein [Vibrio chagasii]
MKSSYRAFIEKLKVVITPLSGIVITTIGISLIKVGVTDIAGGVGARKTLALEAI